MSIVSPTRLLICDRHRISNQSAPRWSEIALLADYVYTRPVLTVEIFRCNSRPVSLSRLIESNRQCGVSRCVVAELKRGLRCMWRCEGIVCCRRGCHEIVTVDLSQLGLADYILVPIPDEWAQHTRRIVEMVAIGKLDLEELDIKWQMAMLSVRINRFEKKAGRKMKFNNKDAARFDKKKVKCYKCSELGHFARECTGKQLDSKARYSSFKLKELDKSEEPKALLSVDSMLNWSDHEGEDVENGAAQVYGMIAGAEDDAAGSATGDATGDVADDVSNAAAEFALMGISSQVHTCPFGCEHLYAELKKEFDNVEVQYKE
ncbi:putative ribonuclease H-like domain-containing protein [Tanacetum coccineum]